MGKETRKEGEYERGWGEGKRNGRGGRRKSVEMPLF